MATEKEERTENIVDMLHDLFAENLDYEALEARESDEEQELGDK